MLCWNRGLHHQLCDFLHKVDSQRYHYSARELCLLRNQSYLITEELRFLYHHPHLRAEIRDPIDLERAVVPLRQETIRFFEFSPEEDRSR